MMLSFKKVFFSNQVSSPGLAAIGEITGPDQVSQK